MTKRFTPHKQMTTILEYECAFDDCERKWLSVREVIDKLNNLSYENNYLNQYNSKLLKKPSLSMSTIPNVMEIMEINTKLEEENEELKKENSLFKEIFNEMLIQTQVEIQPNTTKYGGTFIFTGEQFQLLRELMKED